MRIDGAVGHDPPLLSRIWAQGPAKDYRGAEGVCRADGTGRQRSPAQALQTRLDVEPVLFVGGVHRDRHAVCWKGNLLKCFFSFSFARYTEDSISARAAVDYSCSLLKHYIPGPSEPSNYKSWSGHTFKFIHLFVDQTRSCFKIQFM